LEGITYEKHMSKDMQACIDECQNVSSNGHRAFVGQFSMPRKDSIRVRSRFIRYLKDANGNEFVALHFEQFHCANRPALCT